VAEDVVVIAPTKGWQPLRLRLLWSFRELGYFFVWRELKLRYKQTWFGASWAVLQPALLTIIFTLVFGRLAKLPSDGIPYALFSFAGMVAWTYFASATNQAVRSLTSGSSLVSRIYFPRLLLPLGAALSFVLDLLVGLAVSVVLMAVYDHWPGAAIVTLPFFFVLLLLASLGLSFLFAALNAQYRDVQYVVPLVMQVWLFATPVAYAISLIPEQYRLLYSVNPMVSVVDGFRWALLDTTAPTAGQVAVSSASALLLFVIGAFVFRRMERTFADVL